ncbi:MAG: DUF1080 domain-containing protein [Isosphaeraceae bacterium]
MRTLCLCSMVLAALMATALADDPKPNDKTLGQAPPEGAVVLFDGKNLDAWVKGNGKDPADWPVANDVMTVGKGNIQTEKTFGDFKLHVEFNVPYMPDKKGQARGNSGVYLAGIYELQVLDSYGLKPQTNDCGAIYLQHAPAVNACKPPLRWQTYDVTFHKARGNQKARVTVLQNGITILDDKEIEPTPGGINSKAGDDGPILLQYHGNKVQYRNLWIEPIK